MKTKAIYSVISQPYRWSHLLSQNLSAATGGPRDLVDQPQPGGARTRARRAGLPHAGARPHTRWARTTAPPSPTQMAHDERCSASR